MKHFAALLIWGWMYNSLLVAQVSGANNNNLNQPEQADETALTETPEAPSLSEAYLKSAREYLYSGNEKRAREFLQKSANESDDASAREARMLLLSIRAREGQTDLDADFDFLSEEDKPRALYLMARGWDEFSAGHPERKAIRKKAMEYYSQLNNRYPQNEWALRSVASYSQGLVQQKKHRQALTILVDSIQKMNELKQPVTPEMYYLLGQALEGKGSGSDATRAYEAYKKVVNDRESIYYQRAILRMRHIEKFYISP